jgi:dienelactone hydrolase
MIRSLKSLGSSSLFLLVASFVTCVGQRVDLPAPSGPYPPGTTIVDWIDPSRGEPFAKDARAHRELLVQIWYPARLDRQAELAPYIPEFDKIFPYRKTLHDRGLALLGRGIDRLKSLRTHSRVGVALSDAQPRYPVLIFSPGNGVPRSLYTIQMEELASHGYVVAAIDHPYSVAIVAFPDGRVAIQPDTRENQPSFEERVATRAADARFVLNQMERLAANDPAQLLTGRLDLERVGIFGHSLGGVAAVLACTVDRRFKAALNLDGGTGEMSDNLERGIEQPFMLMVKAQTPASAATDKQLAAWELSREQYEALMKKDAGEKEANYKKLKAAAYRVSIRGAQHMSFSDVPLLERDNHGLDARRGLGIISTYTLAFFNKYLNDEDSALLDGPSAAYPEVISERFGPRRKH